MTQRTPRWSGWAPMPEVGTMRVCQFCHFTVTLSQTPHGSYLWTAARDPLDGGRHCLGGEEMDIAQHPTPRTLHLPDAPADGGPQLAWWYTPDGEPRAAQSGASRRTA